MTSNIGIIIYLSKDKFIITAILKVMIIVYKTLLIGIEPMTYRLTVYHSNQLSYKSIFIPIDKSLNKFIIR